MRFLSALLSAAWIRNIFIQVWVANTYCIVPQAIVDFLPSIIQTYQYISCMYRISVQLYTLENHKLVITQQFLVLHKGYNNKPTQPIRKVCWLSQLQANLKKHELPLYHRGTRDVHVDKQFECGI